MSDGEAPVNGITFRYALAKLSATFHRTCTERSCLTCRAYFCTGAVRPTVCPNCGADIRE